MPDRYFAAAAQRNASPILAVLRREFAERNSVIEIGSGTGQHAVAFASEMTHLEWQPSDVAENCPGIRAWLKDSGIRNVLPPLELDVRYDDAGHNQFDAAFSANTAHIMDKDAVRRMFAVTGKALVSGGSFCLYGPFRIGARFNAPSNAAFDASLRQQSPAMGIRDLETLEAFALSAGMRRERLYAMPSNNYVVLWRAGEGA
ncbi:MAG: DUF938 domain-containing protein [Woeseiaceae bacterium]|nr:DUF938 domain-containing protein [Woeseiaceae bacterium]